MSSEEVFINGELLRLSRESRGWVLNDMATRVCLSTKQIRQIEEGGLSSFYSMAVKVTAAKKVGALLGLTPEEVLEQALPESLQVNLAEPFAEPLVSLDAVPLVVQQVVHDKVESDVQPVSNASLAVVTENSKSKTSLWLMTGLIGFALAVAAYMQPQDEMAVEPAPPLQIIPTENVDPASAASSADSVASAADTLVVPASVGLVVDQPASIPASRTP